MKGKKVYKRLIPYKEKRKEKKSRKQQSFLSWEKFKKEFWYACFASWGFLLLVALKLVVDTVGEICGLRYHP